MLPFEARKTVLKRSTRLCRRIVADKTHRQFAADKVCRRRAGGQHVQHFETFLRAVLLNLDAEHVFLARLVATFIEDKARTAFGRLLDGPSGKDLGHFGHIALTCNRR